MNQPSQQFPKWLYHRKHGGRVFTSSAETKWLWLKGWRDRPFPAQNSAVKSSLRTWWSDWEWLFKAATAVLVILAAAVSLWRVLHAS